MTYLTLIIVLSFALFPFISPTMKFRTTLRHVDHNIKNATKTERLRLALGRSKRRLQWLLAASKHFDVEAPITFHGHPTGEYLMDISIGTPPVPFSAIMDTGGGITWIQCGPCQGCSRQSTPIFNRTKSSSYRALRCPNPICNLFYSSICEERPCGSKCTYNFTYDDGTGSQGDLATETLWFEANTIPIQGALIGCGLNDPGYLYGSAGTVGLARYNDTLVSQLNISAFSYCLPSVMSNGIGRFFMGCEASAPPGALATPLLKSPFNSLYYLHLQGISIGGFSVPINTTAFVVGPDGSGGMIIDSGTTITSLDRSTFEAVVLELARQVRLPRVHGRMDPDLDLDLCFNVSEHDLARTRFPKFVLQFEGANLELPRDNYFLFVEEMGIGCLAMVTSDDGPYSILGNFQQQNMVVVYDLANDKLSFVTNTNCDNM